MPSKKTSTRKPTLSCSKLREKKINDILEMVKDMCEYATENLCNEESQFEELEFALRTAIK